MVTTRTPIGRPPRDRITPEIVALYIKIRDADDDADMRDERVALHTKLGRRIWEYTIEGIDPDAESSAGLGRSPGRFPRQGLDGSAGSVARVGGCRRQNSLAVIFSRGADG